MCMRELPRWAKNNIKTQNLSEIPLLRAEAAIWGLAGLSEESWHFHTKPSEKYNLYLLPVMERENTFAYYPEPSRLQLRNMF